MPEEIQQQLRDFLETYIECASPTDLAATDGDPHALLEGYDFMAWLADFADYTNAFIDNQREEPS